MNKKFENILKKALLETKGKEVKDIILYCDNKIKRAKIQETKDNWEEVKNQLLKINENIKFKIGEKVHWLKANKEVNYERIDIIDDVVVDIWGDVRYKTKEVVKEGEHQRIGIAYNSYLVSAS